MILRESSDMDYIEQIDAMDCGPSCLAMIIKHYGRQVDQDNLRQSCSLGKIGRAHV